MADENAIELVKRGDRKFSARVQLDTMRQEIALNFAPYLASWTTDLVLGDDYASHLVDGTPMLLARDFIGQIGAMLRPPGKQYAWHRAFDNELNEQPEVREYLDWRSRQMMRILHDRTTGYMRATKQADEFFGLFGDAVLSLDYASAQMDQLRVRAWHTKDVAWSMGDDDRAEVITRREMVPARLIAQRFPKAEQHENVKKALDKDPDQCFQLRHEVMPAAEYDAYRKRALKRSDGWVSIWIDAEHQTILSEKSCPTRRYVIPRWVTLPQWSYAISPCSVVALPDARLLQQQALALLEAAEKSVNPPLVAYQDAIRGDVSLAAGDITWVDREYDSRSGQPVEAISLSKNPALGVDVMMRTEQQITRAFFLDRIRMPDTTRTKSTLETQFLIDEYVRSALPLFAPMQVEYNDAMLFEADEMIDRAGGYGGRDLPADLDPKSLTFQWDNPLSDMIERQKANVAQEVASIGQAIAAIEAAAQQAPALAQIDTTKMFREVVIALKGAGWIKSEDELEGAVAGQADANAQAGMMSQAAGMAPLISAGAQAAKVASEAVPLAAEPNYPLLPAPG